MRAKRIAIIGGLTVAAALPLSLATLSAASDEEPARPGPVEVTLAAPAVPGAPNTVEISIDGMAASTPVDVDISSTEGAPEQPLAEGVLDAAGEEEVPVTLPTSLDEGAELYVTVDGVDLPALPIPVVEETDEWPDGLSPVKVIVTAPQNPGEAGMVEVSSLDGSAGGSVDVALKTSAGAAEVPLGEGQLDTTGSDEIPVDLPVTLPDGAALIVSINGQELPPLEIPREPTAQEAAAAPDPPIEVVMSEPVEAGQPNVVTVTAGGEPVSAPVQVAVIPDDGAPVVGLGSGRLDSGHEEEIAITLPPNTTEDGALIVKVDGVALPPMSLATP